MISPLGPFSKSFPLNYTQHHHTGPAEKQSPQERCWKDHNCHVQAAARYYTTDSGQRLTAEVISSASYCSTSIFLTTFLFFSKLPPLIEFYTSKSVMLLGLAFSEMASQSSQQLPELKFGEFGTRSQERISIFIPGSIFMLSGDNEISLKFTYFIY